MLMAVYIGSVCKDHVNVAKFCEKLPLGELKSTWGECPRYTRRFSISTEVKRIQKGMCHKLFYGNRFKGPTKHA